MSVVSPGPHDRNTLSLESYYLLLLKTYFLTAFLGKKSWHSSDRIHAVQKSKYLPNMASPLLLGLYDNDTEDGDKHEHWNNTTERFLKLYDDALNIPHHVLMGIFQLSRWLILSLINMEVLDFDSGPDRSWKNFIFLLPKTSQQGRSFWSIVTASQCQLRWSVEF